MKWFLIFTLLFPPLALAVFTAPLMAVLVGAIPAAVCSWLSSERAA
jgi:hypothetical protein